ncbi:rod-binding protein [Sphingomonas sp. RHCKR7]|uniref:rod-binding protein n=1 Tax=Sphingomonas folli TaxID=2862497 RepID=UPI001CA5E0D6|nr:rod-binding protein [Sphingomonas folli]MBW6525546.1 rod-binding protein [Sphingomonas folli]
MDPIPPRPTLPTRALPDAAAVERRGAAKEFEAVFLGEMTKFMLEEVQQGDVEGGHGEEIFRGVLAEKIGSAMATRGGIGIAADVEAQLRRLDGARP